MQTPIVPAVIHTEFLLQLIGKRAMYWQPDVYGRNVSLLRINLKGNNPIGILPSLRPIDSVNLWIDDRNMGTVGRKLELLTLIKILVHNPVVVPNRVVRRDDSDTILNLKVA